MANEHEDGRQLTEAEAAEYDALRALGTAKDLKAQLDELPPLRAFKGEIEAAAVAGEAAELLDWNPLVLAKLARHEGLAIVMRDGKPYVRPAANATAEPVPLTDEYAEQHFAEFVPALIRTDADPAKGRVLFPRQTGTAAATGARREAAEARALADARQKKMNAIGYGI